jgi:hypothetical protein
VRRAALLAVAAAGQVRVWSSGRGFWLDELSIAYRALAEQREPELPALGIQYADYAEWELERLESGELDAAIGELERALADSRAELAALGVARYRPDGQEPDVHGSLEPPPGADHRYYGLNL